MADATNSSLREIKIELSNQCDTLLIDYDTAITVEIRPRNRNHWTYVIYKMALTKDCHMLMPYLCKSSLVIELNLRLQNLITENDLSFPYQCQHQSPVPYGNSLFFDYSNSLS